MCVGSRVLARRLHRIVGRRCLAPADQGAFQEAVVRSGLQSPSRKPANARSSARSSASPRQASSRKAPRSSRVRSAACANSVLARRRFCSFMGFSSGRGPLVHGSRRTFTQPLRQPGPRKSPIARQGTDRHADNLGRFLDAQTRVIAKPDNFRQTGVFGLELLDRLIEGQHIAVRRFDPGEPVGQLDPLCQPSVFETGLVAGLVDRGCRASLARRRRRNGAGLSSRDPYPAPGEDTPRGPEPSAGGSGRGTAGPS